MDEEPAVDKWQKWYEQAEWAKPNAFDVPMEVSKHEACDVGIQTDAMQVEPPSYYQPMPQNPFVQTQPLPAPFAQTMPPPFLPTQPAQFAQQAPFMQEQPAPLVQQQLALVPVQTAGGPAPLANPWADLVEPVWHQAAALNSKGVLTNCFEFREEWDMYYCRLCNTYATDDHLQTRKHQYRISHPRI